MNILETFVTSLPATLERARIVDQMDTTVALINEGPAFYITASQAVGDIADDYTSKEAKALLEQFYRLTRVSKKAFQNNLLEFLGNIIDNLTEAQKIVTKTFPKTITRDTLTYRQLGFIQFAAACDMVVNFTPKVLTYLIQLETCHLANERIDQHMTKAAIKEIQDNWVQYLQVLRTIGSDPKFVTQLDSAADLVVEAGKVDIVLSTHGATKINPMVNGFVPPKYNPFRMLGMALAEWQAKRYHEFQEQLSLFQVLLAYQKQLLAKEVDPAVERRIEELSSVIEELQAKINKMEKRYG